MKRRPKGIAFLIIGLIALAGGIAVLVWSAMSFVTRFSPVAVLASPGEVKVHLADPGVYTLWHDHQTIYQGATVGNPPQLPSGFTYQLVRNSDRVQCPIAPIRMETTLSTGSRQAVGVATVQTNRAGDHTLYIENPDKDVRLFSLTQGSFLEGLGLFMLWIILGGLSCLAGLVFLILGIVFLFVAPKRNTPPPPPVPG